MAAADGSSLGNPGPGGWAWFVDDTCWASGGWPRATNNQGELTAVIDLLEQSREVEDLLVLLDSQYVLKSATEWIPGWKKRGWRKGDGKPVQNAELMQRLDAALESRRAAGLRTEFEWVRGHSGQDLNERADQLAQRAARAFQDGRTADAGPGMRGAPSSDEHRAPAKEQEASPTSPEPDLFDGLDFAVDASDEGEVVRLERQLLDDAVRADPASVAALLHPEWEEIGASGRRWSRDEMLAEITPLTVPEEFELLAIHELSTEAVLIVWRSVGEHSALRSSVWVREGGRWRQRFHQGTRES